MRIHLILADGTEKHVDEPFAKIPELIGAESLDTVNLHDGRVMLVDDLGHGKGRSPNEKATKLYHSVCYPGTTHQIVGAVAIVVDAEVNEEGAA